MSFVVKAVHPASLTDLASIPPAEPFTFNFSITINPNITFTAAQARVETRLAFRFDVARNREAIRFTTPGLQCWVFCCGGSKVSWV